MAEPIPGQYLIRQVSRPYEVASGSPTGRSWAVTIRYIGRDTKGKLQQYYAVSHSDDITKLPTPGNMDPGFVAEFMLEKFKSDLATGAGVAIVRRSVREGATSLLGAADSANEVFKWADDPTYVPSEHTRGYENLPESSQLTQNRIPLNQFFPVDVATDSIPKELNDPKFDPKFDDFISDPSRDIQIPEPLRGIHGDLQIKDGVRRIVITANGYKYIGTDGPGGNVSFTVETPSGSMTAEVSAAGVDSAIIKVDGIKYAELIDNGTYEVSNAIIYVAENFRGKIVGSHNTIKVSEGSSLTVLGANNDVAASGKGNSFKIGGNGASGAATLNNSVKFQDGGELAVLDDSRIDVTGKRVNVTVGSDAKVSILGAANNVVVNGVRSLVSAGGNGQDAINAADNKVTFTRGGEFIGLRNSSSIVEGKHVDASVEARVTMTLLGMANHVAVSGGESIISIGGNGKDASGAQLNEVVFNDGGTLIQLDNGRTFAYGKHVDASVGSNSSLVLNGMANTAVVRGTGSSINIGGNGQFANSAQLNEVIFQNGGELFQGSDARSSIKGNGITVNIGAKADVSLTGSGNKAYINGVDSELTMGGNGSNAAEGNRNFAYFNKPGLFTARNNSRVDVQGDKITALVGSNVNAGFYGNKIKGQIAGSGSQIWTGGNGQGQYSDNVNAFKFMNGGGINVIDYGRANIFGDRLAIAIEEYATANLSGAQNYTVMYPNGHMNYYGYGNTFSMYGSSDVYTGGYISNVTYMDGNVGVGPIEYMCNTVIDGEYFYDPIVLSLNKAPVSTVNVSNSGAYFDVFGDGTALQSGWGAPGSGYLVDTSSGRNHVGSLNDLIHTFSEMRLYDSNGDRQLDANDESWSDLSVWVDAAGRAEFEPGTLRSLDEIGIKSISLNEVGVGQYDNGNIIQSSSLFEWLDGSSGDIAQVDFQYYPSADPKWRDENPVNEYNSAQDSSNQQANGLISNLSTFGVDNISATSDGAPLSQTISPSVSFTAKYEHTNQQSR